MVPNIAALRRLAGLPQLEVCRRAGIGRTRLSQAENGLRLRDEQYGRITRAIDELSRERTAQVKKAVASAGQIIQGGALTA